MFTKAQLTELAAACETMSEGYLAMAGIFRTASKGGAAAGGNAKAGGKSKPAADDLDLDAVKEALKSLAEAKGKDKVAEALTEVGAGRLSDVDESQYEELMTKITELMEAEDEPEPAAKKTRSRSKKVVEPEVDMDSVTVKFKALLKADKPAAVKLLKKLGIDKFGELDEDDIPKADKLIDAAMPEDDDNSLV
jgi:hypothetical protein